jgi:hypothetical protein
MMEMRMLAMSCEFESGPEQKGLRGVPEDRWLSNSEELEFREELEIVEEEEEEEFCVPLCSSES